MFWIDYVVGLLWVRFVTGLFVALPLVRLLLLVSVVLQGLVVIVGWRWCLFGFVYGLI